MRTEVEILAKLKQKNDPFDDMFGAQRGRLMEALSFETARKEGLLNESFLKEVDAGKDPEWTATTDETLRASIVDYLGFAWGKCLEHRGISASRSLSHFRALCWLLEDEEAVLFINDDNNYAPYGAPVLAYLSKRFSYPMPKGIKARRMSNGLPCVASCEEGCQ